MEFLKEALGEELFAQLEEKANAFKGKRRCPRENWRI